MSTAPTVTVLVPTLRRPQLLDKTLQALRRQDYPELDILVSDNGSGDETPAVIASHLADPRVRARSNPATIDMVSHWNQCLWEARGELVILVSDDDLVAPDFISAQVAAFAKNPRVSITLPRTEIINAADEVVEVLKTVEWADKPGHAFLCDWLWGTGRNPIRTFLTTMMRTRAAWALGGWPNFPGGANSDNALFFAMALQGEVAFCRDTAFYYRVDTQSYGLRVDFVGLAESARRFRVYLRQREVAALVEQQTPEVARRLLEGVSHMLARQYFFRLHGLVSTRMRADGDLHQRTLAASLTQVGGKELVRALIDYPLDLTGARSFVHYGIKTAKKSLHALRLRSRAA